MAGAILFAVLAAAGRRECRSWATLALAVIATATLGYAMFVDYSLVTEFVGFALLAAAVRDHRRHRIERRREGRHGVEMPTLDMGA